MTTVSMMCIRAQNVARGCRRFNNSSHSIQGTIPFGGNGVKVSQYAKLERTFTEKDVETFGTLIGDTNQIHLSNSTTTNWTDNIPGAQQLESVGLIRWNDDGTTQPLVHGMLVASLFSSILGTLIPGAVYRSQSLSFRAPVFVNEPVVAQIEVLKVREKSRIGGVVIVCDSKVMRGDTECITGEAHVWLPGGQAGE